MKEPDHFTESVENVQEMNRHLNWTQETSITKDEVFKEIVKFKWTAAILLKNCIPEYKDLPPLDIAKLIKDERDRGKQTDEEIIQDEIDLISGTEGTGIEKNTIKDVTFRAYSGVNSLFINVITVNFEMQNKFRKKKPNTISRSVYYAASGLRATVPAGDKEYANIHKVYTIWLCAEDVVFRNGKDTAFIQAQEKAAYVYKHRFGIFRFYDELPGRAYSRDEESDLMEVVMVDLKVLQAKVEDWQCGHASDDERVMLETIYNIKDAIGLMEQIYKVSLTGYGKEVQYTMSLMERVEEQKRVIEEQKRVNEEQKRVNEEQGRQILEKDKMIEELKRMVAELQGKHQLS